VNRNSAARANERGLAYLFEVAALAAVYVIAARAGLKLNAVSGFATLVWPPSGMALAGLLIAGIRLWPGVFIGATVANILTGAPLLIAGGIGVGNTLEVVLAVYALLSIPDFHRSLDRVRDVMALIVLAALASTAVAATIGVTSLRLGRIVSAGQAGETWRAWWFGDMIGDLLVAPMILVWWWRGQRLAMRPGRAAGRAAGRAWEAIALVVCLGAASVFVFSRGPNSMGGFEQPYILFPLLIWAAIRFGGRGSVTALFVISVVAVWGTVLGYGPFIRPVLSESLLDLQVFMGVTAATFLLLGAAVSGHWTTIAALERAIAEQTHLHETAADANRAKAQFMAVMSHELRTPLNAIGGYVELIEAGIRGPVTPLQAQDLERIRRNQRLLVSVVTDILNFAKVESGHIEYHLDDLPLRDVLGRLEDLVRPQLAAKGLHYRMDGGDPGVFVRADQDKLEQVLLNLLSNAIKFTPSDGTIAVVCEPGEERIVIRVSDSGRGISADKLDAVFEPFVQVDRSLTSVRDGVGLGLAISRALARAMGGDLVVRSEVGVGSAFSLALPRAPEHIAAGVIAGTRDRSTG
jgi:signal transduction histidine kinase